MSETEDQAEDHLQNIGAMLESKAVEASYPDLADRSLGKYGNAKGWRRDRLRTASGFTIDALGLDVAARGAKLEEQRPDFMVFDDIDGEADTHGTTEKKIRTITRKLLPAGAPDLAVLAIQNLVLEHGVFAQIVDGRADFLRRRIVSGPIPAAYDLEVEQTDAGYRVLGGTPTWAGQDLADIEDQINDWGYSAFLVEAQHEVEAPAGGMFDHLEFRRCTQADLPWDQILVIALWCDPAVTDKDSSDAYGIHADALAKDGTIYRLYSWEQRSSPLVCLTLAIRKAVALGAYCVGVETDQGGDTWRDLYAKAWQALVSSRSVPEDARMPQFREAKAGAGAGNKVHRAQQMLADYERGRFVHVMGTHTTLEKALRRFPKTKPYDLVDASVWSWADLSRFRAQQRPKRTFVFGASAAAAWERSRESPQEAWQRKAAERFGRPRRERPRW